MLHFRDLLDLICHCPLGLLPKWPSQHLIFKCMQKLNYQTHASFKRGRILNIFKAFLKIIPGHPARKVLV